jgi:hypothetical protein
LGGCEEGDQVEGEGTAELPHDRTIETDFAYDDGDVAVLKAKRDSSSAACQGVLTVFSKMNRGT